MTTEQKPITTLSPTGQAIQVALAKPALNPAALPPVVSKPMVTVNPTKAATTVGSPVKAFNSVFKIESLDEVTTYLNLLVYGKYGSGKTTLVASACDVDEMADVLLIDVESGQMAIRKNDRIKRTDRIDVVRVSSFKQVAQVHKYLLAHTRLRDRGDIEGLRNLEAQYKGVSPDTIKEPKQYRSAIIDSLSELNTLCIYELLGLSTNMDLENALKDGDMEVPEWAEYKKNNQVMQLILRAFRDLPMNTLYTCHAGYVQDEMKRFHYSLGLTGKLASQAQGFMDIVGYLVVGQLAEGQKDSQAPRQLRVQPTGKFDAKNRRASFKAAHFDNPLMSTIWKAIN